MSTFAGHATVIYEKLALREVRLIFNKERKNLIKF